MVFNLIYHTSPGTTPSLFSKNALDTNTIRWFPRKLFSNFSFHIWPLRNPHNFLLWVNFILFYLGTICLTVSNSFFFPIWWWSVGGTAFPLLLTFFGCQIFGSNFFKYCGWKWKYESENILHRSAILNNIGHRFVIFDVWWHRSVKFTYFLAR